MRIAITLLCVLGVSGCTLLNRPDPGRLDAALEVDGGLDAGPDGDAGDSSMCPRLEQHEASCDNEIDDDCDGLEDCNDFDCGRALGCCGEGGGEEISEFVTTARWTSLPTGVSPSIAPELDDDVIGNFFSVEPRALRYDECLPVDLGIEIRARVRAAGRTCPVGEPCDHASIVLTPLSEMARGVPLADELSVRLYTDGFVEVRRAGTVLHRSPAAIGRELADVSIQLTPGIDDDGEAWVYAYVQIVSADLTWAPWETLQPLIPREDLIGASLGCEQARGLHLALEGIGDGVEIDSVTVDPRECANPSHFQRPAGGVVEIDRTSVDADDWSQGGVGAPALSTYFLDDASPETWTLLYDGTNVPRTNELSAPVRFAIGASQTTRADGIGDWMARGAEPLIGSDPPQCPACTGSVREPTLLLPIQNDRGLASSRAGWVVYARELEGSGGRRFGLEARSLVSAPFDVGRSTYELLTPAAEGECTSLRDPLLLPIAPESTDDAWLVYSCERSGTLREIRIARFRVTSEGPTAETMGLLLDAAMVGPIASITLRAADAATWFVTDELVIHRLWLATRDLMGRTAIAFAEASGVPDALPVFQAYAANPVLRADDPLFGDCSGADCDIDSVAVARTANSPNRVRLLIARTIRSATTLRHVFAPLDQIWPEPVP